MATKRYVAVVSLQLCLDRNVGQPKAQGQTKVDVLNTLLARAFAA